MSSDFVSEETGVLRYADAVWEQKKRLPDVQAEIAKTSEERARRAGRVFSVSQEGYYNSDAYLGETPCGHTIFLFSRVMLGDCNSKMKTVLNSDLRDILQHCGEIH